jgi:hypothetical protein
MIILRLWTLLLFGCSRLFTARAFSVLGHGSFFLVPATRHVTNRHEHGAIRDTDDKSTGARGLRGLRHRSDVHTTVDRIPRRREWHLE